MDNPFQFFGGTSHPMAHMSNYMIHCHILEHEDHGMMAQFKVVPEGAGSM